MTNDLKHWRALEKRFHSLIKKKKKNGKFTLKLKCVKVVTGDKLKNDGLLLIAVVYLNITDF